MKLFHHPMSSSARRVTVTAATLGLTFEERLIDLANADDRQALAAVNPNRKIPVLVDGDFVLWESHAIMKYLCAQVPGQTLYPADAKARADVDRWLFWTSQHLSPAVGSISFERLWKKLVNGGEADAAIVARYEAFFHTFAKVIDAHLADRTWLAGKDVTLADISVTSTLMYRVATKLPIESYVNLRRLVERVEALPAWQATEPARRS